MYHVFYLVETKQTKIIRNAKEEEKLIEKHKDAVFVQSCDTKEQAEKVALGTIDTINRVLAVYRELRITGK